MVEILYHRDRHRVSVTGHAGGEIGQDLVCASVTTLVYTLATFVENMEVAGQDHLLQLRKKIRQCYNACI